MNDEHPIKDQMALATEIVTLIRQHAADGSLHLDDTTALGLVVGLMNTAYTKGLYDGTRESGERTLAVFDEVAARHKAGHA